MSERLCPGLPADWLNAWLAAIGALVVAPVLRLSWSDDPVPLAVLHAPGGADPADLIASVWPTAAEVAGLPIAEHHPGDPHVFGRNATAEAWRSRCDLARRHPMGWTITSTLTDLVTEDWPQHAPLDAAAPGSTGPLHRRLQAVHQATEPRRLDELLNGASQRIPANGLGFDVRRIAGSADKYDKTVDPAIETLAFYGLALFPARSSDGRRVIQRGWLEQFTGFLWPAWRRSLQLAAIDALLDICHQTRRPPEPLGVSGMWESVRYLAKGKEKTVGYGSQRVDGPWNRR